MRQIYIIRKVKRMETPSYIKALVKPNGTKAAGRRVWGIDLETVWLPGFIATNTMGDTAIPHDALGAPLRLAYNPDGSVKFSKTGRPVLKVAKDLQDSVRMVRENFIAGWLAYAKAVREANPEGYKAEIAKAQEAGKPIIEKDRQALEQALAILAEAQAEAATKAKAKVPNAELAGVA
jgi:hypothetical protein